MDNVRCSGKQLPLIERMGAGVGCCLLLVVHSPYALDLDIALCADAKPLPQKFQHPERLFAHSTHAC